jgi:hypothetical protein
MLCSQIIIWIANVTILAINSKITGDILDTSKYFVVCANILGSCYGSTGPTSINPLTGKRYGNTFPEVHNIFTPIVHGHFAIASKYFLIQSLSERLRNRLRFHNVEEELQSFYNNRLTIACSLNHFEFASQGNRSTILVQKSICNRCAIAVQSLCNRCGIALQSLK